MRRAWCRLMAWDWPLWSCSGATTQTSRAICAAISSSTFMPGASIPSSLVSRTRSSTVRTPWMVAPVSPGCVPRGKRPASRKSNGRTVHADHRCTGAYLGQRQAQRASSPDLALHRRGIAAGNGPGRGGWRGAASAKLGPAVEPAGDRRRGAASGQVLHPGLVSAGRSVAAGSDRDLEAAAGDAGPALVADAGGAGALAQGRHDGLAVAGGGEGRRASGDDGLAL